MFSFGGAGGGAEAAGGRRPAAGGRRPAAGGRRRSVGGAHLPGKHLRRATRESMRETRRRTMSGEPGGTVSRFVDPRSPKHERRGQEKGLLATSEDPYA